MVHCLGVMASLFAGIMAAIACVVLGLLASVAAPDTSLQANHDPIEGFDPAIVSPPKMNAVPPVHLLAGDRLEKAALFAVTGIYTLPALDRLAFPTGSTIESRAARGIARNRGDGPQLGLTESGPDELFRFDEVSHSPTVPRPGNIGSVLLAAPAELSVALRTIPRSGGAAEPTGPEHFLQAGYFAYRDNAAGLFEKLANARLNVLMEQTMNRFGKTRWRVLVGPYHHERDALRARNAAPKLLAKAFHTIKDK